MPISAGTLEGGPQMPDTAPPSTVYAISVIPLPRSPVIFQLPLFTFHTGLYLPCQGVKRVAT